jgi:hypothetical protein
MDRATLAEQHLPGLKRVDHGDDQQLATLRRSSGIGMHDSTVRPGSVLALGHQVAHRHRMTPVEQPQRHAQAHVADADDGDAGDFNA